MLFADFTHPSTIAVLLLEAALLGLALAAAFVHMLVRPARWLTRSLVVVTIVLGLLFAAGMILELWTSNLPFVLPDAPLGTYGQMTQVGLLLGIAQFSVIVVGAALAFRRPALGGLVLVCAALFGLLEEGRKGLQDPSLPLPNLVFGVVAVALPVLVVGALVLATWWSEHGPSSHAARSDLTHRVHHNVQTSSS